MASALAAGESGGGFGGYAGTAASVGGSFLGMLGDTELANAYASSASKTAWDRYQYAQVMRYPWQVQSLEMAHLNPMLAVTQGAPGAAYPSTATTQGPDFEGAIGKGVSAAGGTIANAKQAQAMDDQLAKIRAERTEAENKALASDRLPEKADADLNATWQSVHNMLSQVSKINSEILLNNAHASRTRAEESYTAGRDRAERARFPFGPEQRSWLRSSPVGKALRSLNRDLRGVLTRGSSSAKHAWENLKEDKLPWDK